MKLDLSKETLLPRSACCECGKCMDAASDDEILQVAASKEFQAVRRAIHAVNAPKEKVT